MIEERRGEALRSSHDLARAEARAGDVFRRLALPAEAVAAYQIALPFYIASDSVLPEHQEAALDIWTSLCDLLVDDDKTSQALREAQRCMEYFEQRGNHDSSDSATACLYARSLQNLADLELAYGDQCLALSQLKTILTFCEKWLAVEKGENNWLGICDSAHSRLVELLDERANYEELCTHHRWWIRLLVNRASTTSRDDTRYRLLQAHKDLARALQRAGNPIDALVEMRETERIIWGLFELDPGANWESSLCDTYCETNKLLEGANRKAEAEAEFKKIRALLDGCSTLEPNKLLVTKIYPVALVLDLWNHDALALEAYTKGLTVAQRTQTSAQSVRKYQMSLGGLLARSGDLGAALEIYETLRTEAQKGLDDDPACSPDRRFLGVMNYETARILLKMGDLPGAEVRSEAAVSEFEYLLDKESAGSQFDYAASLCFSCELFQIQGRSEELEVLVSILPRLDWSNAVPLDGFARDALPRVLAQLDAFFPHFAADLQLEVTIRCLKSLHKGFAPEIKLPWLQRSQAYLLSGIAEHSKRQLRNLMRLL
ncbi:MAG: hypothetical protein ACOYM2_14465 [Rectinemataceae bacterium]